MTSLDTSHGRIENSQYHEMGKSIVFEIIEAFRNSKKPNLLSDVIWNMGEGGYVT